MIDVEELFERLFQRGCRPMLAQPKHNHMDDQEKFLKKLNKRRRVLERWDKLRDEHGRVHPRYMLTDQGRITTRNPSVQSANLFEPAPGSNLLNISPQGLETSYAAQLCGEHELAHRFAWVKVVEALDMGVEDEDRWIKSMFFMAVYGKINPEGSARDMMKKEGLTPGTLHYEDIVAKYPGLANLRRQNLRGIFQDLSDITLLVAQKWEDLEDQKRTLTTIWFDCLVFEGEDLEEIIPWLSDQYHSITGLKHRMRWGDEPETEPMPSKPTRLELLFEEE